MGDGANRTRVFMSINLMQVTEIGEDENKKAATLTPGPLPSDGPCTKMGRDGAPAPSAPRSATQRHIFQRRIFPIFRPLNAGAAPHARHPRQGIPFLCKARRMGEGEAVYAHEKTSSCGHYEVALDKMETMSAFLCLRRDKQDACPTIPP